jgi:hypothetical protein
MKKVDPHAAVTPTSASVGNAPVDRLVMTTAYGRRYRLTVSSQLMKMVTVEPYGAIDPPSGSWPTTKPSP